MSNMELPLNRNMPATKSEGVRRRKSLAGDKSRYLQLTQTGVLMTLLNGSDNDVNDDRT